MIPAIGLTPDIFILTILFFTGVSWPLVLLFQGPGWLIVSSKMLINE